MLRDFIQFAVGIFIRILSRLEVYGLENIPPTGGFIICTNHLGLLDAALVFLVVKRKDTTALVAKKHQKNPFMRWLVNGVNGIWINRDEPDSQAVRQVRNHLQNGGMIGIAPEGTRSKTGGLGPAKTGAAYFADKAGVPIIPCAITGTYRDVYHILHFHRLRITMQFGEPFRLPPIVKKHRDECLKVNTDEIMYRIAAMLPEEYRGIYGGGSAPGSGDLRLVTGKTEVSEPEVRRQE